MVITHLNRLSVEDRRAKGKEPARKGTTCEPWRVGTGSRSP